MSADSLQVQISSARQRLGQLQRRAGQMSAGAPRVVAQALEDLERALGELNLAQERLVVHRESLAESRILIESERETYSQLLDASFDAYVVTSSRVDIVEANRAASELLNMSQRFLVGKSLSVFVCRERGRMIAEARHLAQAGGSAQWLLDIRPRERAPMRITARVIASGGNGEALLRWTLRRAHEAHGGGAVS